MRRSLYHRLIALLLSWAVPATNSWGVAPIVQPGGGDFDSTTSADLAESSPSGGRDGPAVRPLLECVRKNANGSFTAFFGYKNDGSSPVSIPIGHHNGFFPGADNRGQPTTFPPGRSPHYPNPVFSVDFGGLLLVWTLRGPDGEVRTAAASPFSPRCSGPGRSPSPTPTATPTPVATPPPPPSPGCEMPIFGPKRFARTRGPKTTYQESFVGPAWAVAPFTLGVENGEADGQKRALPWIRVNGQIVVRPRDLHRHRGRERDDDDEKHDEDHRGCGPPHASLDLPITLTPGTTATLKVTVVGAPGTHVTVRICGRNGDLTPPMVTWSEPPAGGFTNDTTPRLVVRYQDAMSGADTASLRALLDDVDVSSLFTLGSHEANAELADAMALQEGAHTLRAEVRDRAGNLGAAASSFRVDLTAPVLALQLSDGAYVGQLDPSGTFTIKGSVSDVDPSISIACGVSGQSTPGTIQNGQFTCSVPLTEGKNSVSVRATDSTGHVTEETRTVTYDRTAPVTQFIEPVSGTFTAAPSIEVTAQALDASPVTGTVNGAPASCVETAPAGPDGQALHTCSGTAPLVDGTNAIVFVATDAAGNPSEARALVVVDRVAPVVAIGNPAAGSYHSGGMLTVSGTVTDTAPVVVEVNGIPATCGGLPTCAAGGASFTATIPAMDGPLTVRADARDAAGNLGSAEVGVNVDSAPPLIAITAPADGFVTNATALTIAGTLEDGSPSSVFIDGQPVPCNGSAGPPFTCTFFGPVALSAEGAAAFEVRARDAAGNESARSIAVTVDRTAPMLEIASPSPGAAVGSLPIAVQGTVTDMTEVTVTVDSEQATRTGQAWLASVGALPEGPHTFTVVATDAAGNQTSRTVGAIVDLGPPALSIDAPPPGFLTRESAVLVTATVNDRSAVTATLGGVPMDCTPLGSGSNSCAGSATLDEGDDTLLVSATDATGRTSEQSVTVTRDSIAPTLELLTPNTISRGRPGAATATASDALGVERVVLSVACVAPASCAPQSQTFTAPPYSLALAVPEGVDPGQSLAVTAEAFDRAGNVAQAMRSVRVIGDGTIVGQAVNDATGLPLAGATALLLGPGQAPTRETTTDERGRYSLPTTDLAAVVRIEKDGFTSVERQVNVASGAGTVPVDARLSVLVDEQMSDGTAPLVAGAFSLTLSAGSYRLTPLSPQGLPGLLPLGFSPLATIDARGPVSGAGGSVNGLPTGTLSLVRYDFATHAWRIVAPNLQPSDGALTISLPDQGAYAVVAADPVDPEVAIPAVNEPLEGIAMVAVPITAVSTGQVEPSVIPPTGGTAVGRIAVTSPVALPSGTVVQADITETYTLASGDVASEERRVVDIILYSLSPVRERDGVKGCDPGALCASFPIRPSRTYSTGELLSGKVHLDILAGREGVRGTVGGSASVTLEAGAARLFVAQGALSEDTALVLEEHALSSFLPSTTALVPLAEVVADLSGQTLSVPAELSISSPGVGASDTLVFAKVERVDGIPRYAVVALGELVGDRIVSRPYPGLPGVVKGGRFVLYRLGAPIGFVAGVVSSSVGPVKALVEPGPGDPGSLPFIAFSGIEGSYILASASGQRSVEARVVGTALVASATVGVSADTTTVQNLLLAGAVTTASVNPPDGTLGVNTTTAIEIGSSSALNRATVVPANFALTQLGATPAENVSVPFRLVLASSGRLVSVIPQPALEYSKMYRLEASELIDQVGGAVVVPTTTFRTKDFVTPFYDPKKLVFSMPNTDGIVTVQAPGCHPEPGCFYPGTTILIINSGNGVVLSLTAGNNGEINSELPATINDTIFITINDPLGNTISFQKSEFVDQATGETGVGPGGGTVRSLDGQTELRIPEGALPDGVSFKVSVVPEGELANLFPNNEHERILEGAHLGSMVQIEPSRDTRFRKEVDLAFPLPDFTKVSESERPANPKDAFYFVYRRIERCPEGTTTCPADQRIVVFEAIDDAQVEGEGSNARVVTASFPFSGIVAAELALGVMVMVLGWALKEAATQLPRTGMITGKVLRARFNEDKKIIEYVAVEGAQVSGFDQAGDRLIDKPGGNYATSQKDGTFALWDARYAGGQVFIYALLGQETAQATAYELADSSMARYRYKATANITFPEQAEPPPPPLLQIHVRRKSDAQDVAGYAVAGVPLKVSLTSNYDVTGAQIEGREYSARVSDTDLLTWEVVEDYVPAEVGTVEIVATARSSDTGALVTVTRSLRVLAPGGSVDNVLTKAPRVTAVEPKADEVGVPVSAFLQVFFSEPVKNIRDAAASVENATLVEIDENNAAGPPLPIQISGVRPNGEAVPNITSGSETITSLSIEPLWGLKYGQRYRVSLKSGIQDLDKDAQQNPAPKSLVPFSWSFETFGPEFVGGSAEATGSPAIAVIGSRAYLARTNGFINGTLEGYRIDDPVLPSKLQEEELFAPRPYDIVGAGDDSERLVAIAMGSTSQSKPASVLLYDVTKDDNFQWLGAATLASNAYEGFITRLALFKGSVYAATVRRGIQVVDIEMAKSQVAALLQRPNSALALQQARAALNSDGQGFGHEAVVQTLALPEKPNNTHYYLNDLKAADLAGQTVVVVAGELGLVVASPAFGTINYNGKPEKTETLPGGGQRLVKLEWGHALALARLNDRDVAVVVGLGKIDGVAKTLLLAIDLANLGNPAIVGFLDLGPYLSELQPVDVLVKDNAALIGLQNGARDQGAVLMVSLADVTKPTFAGRLAGEAGKPLGGRLALTDTGLLLSTAKAALGGATPMGGIRTAAFDTIGAVLPVNPVLAKWVEGAQYEQEETLEDVPLELRVYPKSQAVSAATLQLLADGVPVASPVTVPMTGGAGSHTLLKGFRKDERKKITSVMSFVSKGLPVTSVPRLIPIGGMRLTLDMNNDTVVNDQDDADVLSDPDRNDDLKARRFTFWEADRVATGESSFVDYATLRIRAKHGLPPGERVGLRLLNSKWKLAKKLVAKDLGTLSPAPPAGCSEEGKLHLCHETAVLRQLQRMAEGGSEGPQELPGGVIEIPRSLLTGGDNYFLFRCEEREDGQRACPAPRLELLRMGETSFETLDQQRVEIRPFRELTSMVTLRKSSVPSDDPDDDLYKVAPEKRDEPGFEAMPQDAKQITLLVHGYNVSHARFRDGVFQRTCTAYPDFLPNATAFPLCEDPSRAWFAEWGKRLYWVKHPVLARQGGARLVGVSWPGDMPGVHKTLYYSEDEFNAFQAGLPLGRYIQELRGRAGVEKVNIFAHSLGNLVVHNALREVPSSGAPVNYVMNQAAVPSEAFLEQYDPVNAPEARQLLQHARTLGYPDPENDRPDPDWLWRDQEAQVQQIRTQYNCPTEATFAPSSSAAVCAEEPRPSGCNCDIVTAYFKQRAEVNPELEPLLGVPPDRMDRADTPYFRDRWKNKLQGAWTTVFFANVNPNNPLPGVRIFNTYSTTDAVLRIDMGRLDSKLAPVPFHAWITAQVNAKPFGKLGPGQFSEADDPVGSQKWWTLSISGRPSAWRSTSETDVVDAQRALWSGLLAPTGTNPSGEEARLRAIAQRTREWAELAVWYPALSPPAGNSTLARLASQSLGLDSVSLDGLANQGRNVNFTTIGGDEGYVNGSWVSHSYMAVKPLSRVWRGFLAVRSLLAQ